MDATYNGWKNHATWAISLHINNDQGFQAEAQEAAQEGSGYGLLEWFTDAVYDRLDTGNLFDALLIDLLPSSFGDVDWDGIAAGLFPYSAGWNMPGYLGETDPVGFADVDDAIAYIVEAIERHADSDLMVADDVEDMDADVIEQAASEATAAVEAADWRGVSVEYGDLVYWIATN